MDALQLARAEEWSWDQGHQLRQGSTQDGQRVAGLIDPARADDALIICQPPDGQPDRVTAAMLAKIFLEMHPEIENGVRIILGGAHPL